MHVYDRRVTQSGYIFAQVICSLSHEIERSIYYERDVSGTSQPTWGRRCCLQNNLSVIAGTEANLIKKVPYDQSAPSFIFENEF